MKHHASDRNAPSLPHGDSLRSQKNPGNATWAVSMPSTTGAPAPTPASGPFLVAPSRRQSGILLHLTSLPGPHGSGDLGAAAYHFVDWLVAGGQTVWQVLPLGGIGPGNSPYMSPSAFAGNLLLVDLGALHRDGWLSAEEIAPLPTEDVHRIDFGGVIDFRIDRLRRAARRFFDGAAARGDGAPWPQTQTEFVAFCATEADWLDDYALFMTLAEQHGDDWRRWPTALVRRDPAALRQVQAEHAPALAFWKFGQWCFARQWTALHHYAKAHGVDIVGDMPIFVADNSVDVWAHPELFDLDADRRPRVVAGVPPDYFSATGQHWGNPLYRWPAHAAENYAWWIARLRHTLRWVDRVRIDHFRGFVACWEIPVTAATAAEGHWVPAPGAALFAALQTALGKLPVIAEDLGIITREVTALRHALRIPGMRVLQFAFDGKPHNAYLPHNYAPDTVVYTGTHDNDTTRGWWRTLDGQTRQQVASYLGRWPAEIDEAPHWALIRTAASSVAACCIAPMQDALGLGSESRMNRPGDATGAWTWRFTWDQVGPVPADRLAEIARTYGRTPATWAMAERDEKEADGLAG